MTNQAAEWKAIIHRQGEPPLGLSALRRLRDNQCALILIKEMLEPEVLAAARRAIASQRWLLSITEYANGRLTTIGPYLAKSLRDPKGYFAQAAATDSLFPTASLDVRAIVRERLARSFDLLALEVAEEPDGRRYAPAVVRLHADGVANPLHNDHIVRDAAGTGLIVSRLHAQLSCVVCLQECERGGQLRHYRKRWAPADEKEKVLEGLGYRTGVVAGVECFVFRPEAGDVYLINPTNYHEIDTVKGRERQTLGFFIGFRDSLMSRGIAWS
jgi:hypothetical protein